MRQNAVSRRTVVVGAIMGLAAVGLAGCRGAQWYPSDISPDEYVLRGVITQKERLVARYQATIAAGEGPTDLLRTLLADHERHLTALRERLPAGAEPDGAAAPEPSGSPADPVPDPVPETALSVAALRVAESTAAGARGRQLGEVSEASLAQLLASVGACEAGHALLLAQV
ncbi:hypothetical protein [Marinitenerispora sediminis]|uniref:Ferritin-like domain-containing protein n=1 Tax=Marinitenerispora sediminis TaxID=1931232 RepID=A0A368SXX9_9ACTN|nr:hypothetical protein [Marinitenerispora sediminis]RCV48331.1 hypothetical protein DEF24_26415 [Marinitenerispora sediminis]RCV53108.1 hypothetical protein DEF28_11130 [Marinitenerispora sediminis]RCV58550.1 hypothetical protein DEF23_08690 [Marinitenerispora sediminis]